MKNEIIIMFMIGFQLLGITVLYIEKDNLKDKWKDIPLNILLGRVFMFLLPSLVIISLIIRPLGINEL